MRCKASHVAPLLAVVGAWLLVGVHQAASAPIAATIEKDLESTLKGVLDLEGASAANKGHSALVKQAGRYSAHAKGAADAAGKLAGAAEKAGRRRGRRYAHTASSTSATVSTGAALAGALGGMAGAIMGRNMFGGDISVMSGAAVGTGASLASNFLAEDMKHSQGRDVAAVSGGSLVKSMGIGSGLGIAANAVGEGGSASNEGPTGDLKSRVLSGMMGAIAGHFLGAGEAQFAGDAQLNFSELRAAFGDAETVGLDDVIEYTGLKEEDAIQFMEKVGTLDNVVPEEGGRVSVLDMILMLDEDGSGLVDLDELTSGMFNGNEKLAREFLAGADTEEGHNPADAHIGPDEIEKTELFAYLRHFANDHGQCEAMDECLIDDVTLRAAAKVGGMELLSADKAKHFITSVRQSSLSKGTLSESASAVHPTITFAEMVDYLVCRKCEPEDERREALTADDLYAVTKAKPAARRWAVAIDRFSVEQAEAEDAEGKAVRDIQRKLDGIDQVKQLHKHQLGESGDGDE